MLNAPHAICGLCLRCSRAPVMLEGERPLCAGCDLRWLESADYSRALHLGDEVLEASLHCWIYREATALRAVREVAHAH